MIFNNQIFKVSFGRFAVSALYGLLFVDLGTILDQFLSIYYFHTVKHFMIRLDILTSSIFILNVLINRLRLELLLGLWWTGSLNMVRNKSIFIKKMVERGPLIQLATSRYSSDDIDLLLMLDHRMIISTDLQITYSIKQFTSNIVEVNFRNTN